MINLMNTYTLSYFVERVLLLLGDNVDVNNSKSSTSVCCLAFARFFVNFSMELLMRELLITKIVYYRKTKMI